VHDDGNQMEEKSPATLKKIIVRSLLNTLSAGGEAALAAPMSLGGAPLREKDLMEIASLHHQALQKMLAEHRDGKPQELLAAAAIS